MRLLVNEVNTSSLRSHFFFFLSFSCFHLKTLDSATNFIEKELSLRPKNKEKKSFQTLQIRPRRPLGRTTGLLGDNINLMEGVLVCWAMRIMIFTLWWLRLKIKP